MINTEGAVRRGIFRHLVAPALSGFRAREGPRLHDQSNQHLAGPRLCLPISGRLGPAGRHGRDPSETCSTRWGLATSASVEQAVCRAHPVLLFNLSSVSRASPSSTPPASAPP